MGAVTTLLIGHRGAGKTSLLRRLAEVHDLPCFDLDCELARLHGKSVTELFQEGEAAFRDKKRAAFLHLLAQSAGPAVIAVGAGFEGPLPASVHAVWVRRVTDANGRSFLDRPRLHPQLSPWAEYMRRFSIREQRYAGWANQELFLPEGYQGGLEEFFGPNTWHFPYDLTLRKIFAIGTHFGKNAGLECAALGNPRRFARALSKSSVLLQLCRRIGFCIPDAV